MANTQVTIGAVAAQVARVIEEQQELRSLLMDTLKQVLTTAQLQAEATNSFMRLVEAQQEIFKAMTQVGPGTSRDRTEEQEALEWRRQLDERNRADANRD